MPFPLFAILSAMAVTAPAVVARAAAVGVSSSREIDHCYADIKSPYAHMATKTPYLFVSGGIAERRSIPHCKPIRIWMLARHGTRLPSEAEIRGMLGLSKLRDEIVANHVERDQGRLCEKDLENLKQWKPDPDELDVKKAKFLTVQGERDLFSLAKRLRSNYPELLSNASGLAGSYRFRSSDRQRTIASMEAFVRGLFEDETSVETGVETGVETEVLPVPKDDLLMAYKSCKAWQETTKDPKLKKEANEFVGGPVFRELLTNVSRRIGFPENIATEQVMLLYQACRQEKAWHLDRISPWCAVFTESELKALEYEEDLYYYYSLGYGSDLAPRIGCPPLKDLYDRFLKAERSAIGEEEPRGIFYFAHAATVQLLLTSLGLARDAVPPKASNYREMENRQWRTARIVPFAANLKAVFYRCDTEDAPYQVSFHLQEHPILFEGCDEESSTGLCDWERLKKQLEPIALNCNLDFCKGKSSRR